MGRLARGFICGTAAAAVWAAAEPALRRVTRTEYSDVRLLGGGPHRSGGGAAYEPCGQATHGLMLPTARVSACLTFR